MASINLDLGYFRHRKTIRLIARLGRSAEVLPIRLWTYCGEFHSEDGRLAGYSVAEIEGLIGWWGKSGAAVEALVAVGFMDDEGNGIYSVHDWLSHAGHIAAYKTKAEAMRTAKLKALQNDEPNLFQNPDQSSLQKPLVKPLQSSYVKPYVSPLVKPSVSSPMQCSSLQCNALQDSVGVVDAPARDNNIPPHNSSKDSPALRAQQANDGLPVPIMAVIDEYAKAMKFSIETEKARLAFARQWREAAQNLLDIAGGDQASACLAVAHITEWYIKERKKPNPLLSWYAEQYPCWNKERKEKTCG